jgi:non-ribosomal peptide synthetase component F
LKGCGKQERATLFMTLLTVFKVLLIRYCGQEEFVGTPVANRGFAETQSLIGCFVNTLVLRTKLDGDPTFREALGRVE